MGLSVRRVRDDGELRAALALRTEVFVHEQGVPLEEEIDGRDADALHLVAVGAGRVVGTCRLLALGEEMKLGRMAVAREHRGRGIAGELIAVAEDEARAAGARRMVLDAQIGAQPLYERAGYVARGARFLDAGIEHVRMEKALA
jgi:predicted GNAT family N-acyltransferase